MTKITIPHLSIKRLLRASDSCITRHCLHRAKWAVAALACASGLLPATAAVAAGAKETFATPGASLSDAATATPAGSKGVAKVVYWVGDMPDARIDYERELIKQALERTRDEFGDYDLALDRQLRSQERLARDLAHGGGVHILNGPGWSFEPSDDAAIDTRVIPQPLLKGLLGYRQCIIRREDRARFDSIQSISDLKKLSMGQGQGWLDNAILSHNGYSVVAAPALEKLYYMLKRGRFDCLSLGIGEAKDSLAEHDPEGELAIAENLLLFYPLPVFMQVSETDSMLARRMEAGLNRVVQDGTLDKLFNEHFHDEIELMQSPDMRVFRLENPYLPKGLHHIGTDLIRKDS